MAGWRRIARRKPEASSARRLRWRRRAARWKGVKKLDPGYDHTVDLDGTAAARKVQIQPGALLIIRTGFMTTYLERGDWGSFDSDASPGVSVHTAA